MPLSAQDKSVYEIMKFGGRNGNNSDINVPYSSLQPSTPHKADSDNIQLAPTQRKGFRWSDRLGLVDQREHLHLDDSFFFLRSGG